jgi:sarcosine oxidase subunit beta
MTLFDIAIIGGGLAGCSTAFHVRRLGASAVLLERGLCGAQASGVNYGGVRQQGRHLAELPLARRSLGIWRNLHKLVGSDCEYAATGHLKLAKTESQMDALETYAGVARAYGLHLRLLDRQSLRRDYPYLGPGWIGASLCAEDGQANPRVVAPAFARAATALGADIREHQPVSEASYDGKQFRVTLADGALVHARRLINTAGAWGAAVANWFGEAVSEEVMAPNMAVTEPIPHFIRPNLGVCGGDIYLRQIPHGSVIFGGGLGWADSERGVARPLADMTAAASRLAIELVTQLKNVSVIRTWTGIEGRMPDGLPVIGTSSTTPDLFHAFGFSGHGFQLCPAVGAVLAELALEGRTTTPIADFDIRRFLPKQSGIAATG